MITSYDITKKLKEIKPYLVDKFKVKEIGYFGSFAQGDFESRLIIYRTIEYKIWF